MPDPSFSPAAREAFASAPANLVVHHTLELRHPSFKDDNGNPTAARLVRAHKNIKAVLEPDAPLNANEEVEFIAIAFDLELPGVDGKPANEISITIDNVDQVLMEGLQAASASTSLIEVTYRPYLSNDLSCPAQLPPPTFTITQVSATMLQIRATAKMLDLGQVPYPGRTYNPEDYIGLAL